MKKLFLSLLLVFLLSLSAVQAQSATPFFADDFETGDLSHSTNGFLWENSSKGGSVNAGITNENSRSGNYSLKFKWHDNNGDPCDDAWAQMGFSMGQKTKELWLEYYVYYPNGTEGFPNVSQYEINYRGSNSSDGECPSAPQSGVKLNRIWGDHYDNSFKWGANSNSPSDSYDGGSVYTTIIRNPDGALLTQAPNVDPALSGTDGTPDGYVDRGQWHKFQFYMKLSDPAGASNGIYRWWIDNKLVSEATDVVTGAPDGNHYMAQGYLMGWSNAGYNKETANYIDDIKFYSENPGWINNTYSKTDADDDNATWSNDCDDNDPSVQDTITCNYDGNTCGTHQVCANSCPTPPEETCDEADNDCDRIVDEGCASTALNGTVSEPNLVAYYPLDENGGETATDVSGNENYGTIEGNPKWVQGRYGSALLMDGVDDEIRIPHSPTIDLQDEYTFNAWVRLDNLSVGGVVDGIISKGGRSWGIMQNGGDSIIGGKTRLTATHMGDDHWTGYVFPYQELAMLTVVWNRSEVRFYINGSRVSTLEANETLNTSKNPLRIGWAQREAYQTGYIKGLIDEVRLYNTTLSEEKIQSLLNEKFDNQNRNGTSQTPSFVKEDINQDGSVNIFDLVTVAQNIGSSDSGFDLNGDGSVNVFDLVRIVQRIVGAGSQGSDGDSCTPSEEVCDGEDNDCDGEVDEGGVCDTGTSNTTGLVFQDSFESGDLSHSENGFSWGGNWGAGGNTTVTGEHAWSGSNSMSIAFAPRPGLGDSSSALQLDFSSTSPNEMWIEYYIRVPENFRYENDPDGPDNNKWFQVWAGSRSGEDVAITGTMWPGDDSTFNNADVTWARGHDYVPHTSKGHINIQDNHLTSADRGNWHRMRWHVKTSDDGVPNGVVEVWKDDELIYSNTSLYDLNAEDPANTHWDHIRWFGWANVGYRNLTKFHLDDVKIYTQNPGWGSSESSSSNFSDSLHPNEPSNMNVVFNMTGERKHFDGWGETSKWANDEEPRNVEILSDGESPAPPNPVGSGSVLAYRTFAGERGGGLTTLDSFSDIGSQSYQELYISYWVYHDPNYDLSHGHKHWYGGGVFGDDATGPTEYYLSHSSNGAMIPTKQTGPTGSQWLAGNDATWKLGEWQQVELYLKGESSVGAGDGVARLWVDGELMGGRDDIQWTDDTDTSTKFDGIQWYPIAGGTNEHDDYHLVGEFYISGR